MVHVVLQCFHDFSARKHMFAPFNHPLHQCSPLLLGKCVRLHYNRITGVYQVNKWISDNCTFLCCSQLQGVDDMMICYAS